ncbi:MAG: hypothetical protein ABSF69_24885 [Polyangiaceae bacterium]|jgi:hypothetical protein
MTPAVLAKLGDAVESIRSDLSTGELIALPIRAVTGAEPGAPKPLVLLRPLLRLLLRVCSRSQ